MKYLDEVFTILHKARLFGTQTLENGTELIGYLPHIGPKAWLHHIFAPLNDEGIQQIEHVIHKKLPPAMEGFYRHTNGLIIFSTSLSIDGLRISHERIGDAARQPFAVEVPNIHERPRDAKDSFIFIGGYDYDGSNLYIDIETGITYRSDRYRSLDILNQWPSFEDMLLSEVRRLETLFDNNGREIDPDRPTTPEPVSTARVVRK